MKFELVDATGSIAMADLAAYLAAQQTQLRTHYSACFDGDGDADLLSIPRASFTPDMVCRIEPHAPADIEGAEGFHELGTLHVFLDIAHEANTSWTSIMSHEVLEARADTRLHRCVELDDGSIWDYEVCDRVEAGSYMISGVEMSNFNTPACFEPPPGWAPGAAIRLDWLGLSSKPNEIRPGGYAQRFDPSQGWSQVTNGEMRAYRRELAARGLSRLHKRRRRLHR